MLRRAGLHLLQRREHRERTRWRRRRTRRAWRAWRSSSASRPCPDCHGTRLSAKARSSTMRRAQPRSGDEPCRWTSCAIGCLAWPRGFRQKMRPMCGLHHERDDRAHSKALVAAGAGIPHRSTAPARRFPNGERQRVRLDARRAQPHHRRPLRAGRALYRAAPGEHRGAARGHATTFWPTATRS